jgi:hypothetical protein
MTRRTCTPPRSLPHATHYATPTPKSNNWLARNEDLFTTNAQSTLEVCAFLRPPLPRPPRSESQTALEMLRGWVSTPAKTNKVKTQSHLPLRAAQPSPLAPPPPLPLSPCVGATASSSGHCVSGEGTPTTSHDPVLWQPLQVLPWGRGRLPFLVPCIRFSNSPRRPPREGFFGAPRKGIVRAS